MNEIFEKYNLELQEDTLLDQMNIRDQQLKLPGIKHKWVGRLINHKQKVNKLKKVKELAREKAMEEISAGSVVRISNPVLERKADNDNLVKKVDEQIDNEKLIIVYLEKVEKIFNSMTFDVKNVVDIMKLEEL